MFIIWILMWFGFYLEDEKIFLFSVYQGTYS